MADQYKPANRVHGRSQQALHAVRSRAQSGSLFLLFFAGLLLYGMNGLAADSKILLVGRLRLACASIDVLSAHRLTMWLWVVVAGLALALQARL